MTIIYLKIAAKADGTTAYVRLLGEGKDVQQSPLWVMSGHKGLSAQYAKADIGRRFWDLR